MCILPCVLYRHCVSAVNRREIKKETFCFTVLRFLSTVARRAWWNRSVEFIALRKHRKYPCSCPHGYTQRCTLLTIKLTIKINLYKSTSC